MSKKLLIASALCLLCWGAKAQDGQPSATTYDGQNESKAVVLTGLQDGLFSFLSEDNRYLSGTIANSTGFVYDFQDKKFLTFNDFVLHAYFSPDHYVAANPGENQAAYIRYGGIDHELERTIANSSYDNDLSYWNAQPNGDRLVIMGYEWDYGTNDAGIKDSAANHVGLVYDGKTGALVTKLHSYWNRLEPFRHEQNLAYGTRAYAISGDGTVVGGHGAWPTSLVISNNQTMFWDLTDLQGANDPRPGEPRAYAIQDPRFSMSDLTGANHDGSILVGYNEETHHGLIVHFDRANKSFTIDTISPSAGYSTLSFNGLSENGLIIGYCGIEADPGTRQAVIYSEQTKLMTLKSYLYEYYDIDIATDLGCPTIISSDGKIMAGFYYDRGYTMPWYIQLGNERILPRARNVAAKAANTGLVVRIDWQVPLTSEHTLTGYEIYCDDNETPIATCSPAELTYTDNHITPGQHTYYVVAVYGERKADKKSSNAVTVIAEGGYFPVQKIGSRVEYNRYASIYWGLPSSEVVAHAVASVPAAKGEVRIDRTPRAQSATRPVQAATKNAPKYPNAALDYIYDVNMLMYNGYSGTKIGEKYYVSSWQGSSIRIIDQNNEVEKEWVPTGLNHSVLSMVYRADEQKLYCGSTDRIYIINMKNERVEKSFAAPSRHLAYINDVEINGTKQDVLMAGNWNTCVFYSLEGDSLCEAGFDFSNLDASGTAYYDGKLYVASQTGYYQNEIYTFDFASREQVGEPIQVVEDPAVYDMLSLNGEVTSTEDLAYAAGLTVCTLDDGTVALAAVYQCSYTHSRLMFLELESAPGRTGYVLYRNGEPLMTSQTTSRRYFEELTPGTYIYSVKAYGDGKEAAFSPNDTIVISAYTPCLPVKDIKAREAAGWVALEWGVPTQDTAAGIVGFTVFRDGQQLKQLWNSEVSVSFTDFSDLTIGTPYSYRIETLYASGCTASDSTQITLTGEGEAMAPFGIRFDYKKNAASTADNKLYDVTAMWETPMFEDALAIGYGTGEMVQGAAFEGITEYWAGIGWDATDLEMYQGLYLVGMEYMLGDDTRSFDAVVYLNDTLALTQSLRRTQSKAWQTLYFSQSFPMHQPKELVVGYHLTYNEGATPVAIDYSYNKPFYSDLVSFDGLAWYALSGNDIDASWAIRALVARKRDLEEAKNADGSIDYKKLESKIMRLEQPMQATLTPAKTPLVAQASPKAPWTLQGFNLYRQRMDIDGQEEVQLNTEPLKTFSYTEAAPLPEGEYDYTVEAIYAGATKAATATVILEDVSTESDLNKLQLTLYPNPASEVVYVNGAYTSVQILDLGGRVLRQLPNASQIEVGSMLPGTYFFRFADEDGRSATYKVVIR